jgi:hypothetical protein
VDVVIGVRSHTGEMLSVDLRADIEKVVEFLTRKSDSASKGSL